MRNLDILVILACWLAVILTDAHAGIITEPMGPYLLDDYDHVDYTRGDEDYWINDKFSNARMSAVMGTTRYRTTGHLHNGNATALYMLYEYDESGELVDSTNRYYCGGCNGSFELSWDSVPWVRLDIASNYSDHPYHAFVTYGDGSTENFALPLEERARITTEFWGIASDLGIRSIHFGGIDGAATIGGSFAIDNLMIGESPVPAPAVLWLFLTGLLGVIYARVR